MSVERYQLEQAGKALLTLRPGCTGLLRVEELKLVQTRLVYA